MLVLLDAVGYRKLLWGGKGFFALFEDRGLIYRIMRYTFRGRVIFFLENLISSY